MKMRTNWTIAVVALAATLAAGPSSAAEPPSIEKRFEMPRGEYARATSIGFAEERHARSALEGISAAGAAQDCVDASDASGELVLCTSFTDEPGSLKRSLPRTSQLTDGELPLPAECTYENNYDGRFYGDRTSVCGAKVHSFEVWRRVNGTLTMTGQARSHLYSWAYTSPYDLKWAHQLTVDPFFITGEAVGYRLDAEPWEYCGEGCVARGEDFDPTPVEQRAVGVAYFESTPLAAGTRGSLLGGDWRFWYVKSGVQSSVSYASPPVVRCDNELANQSAGCVFYDVLPGIAYNSNTLPEFTDHVIRAQASGLPGGPDRPLNRITDEDRIAENRRFTCPQASWLPRPTGKSCDEYPFASTMQGGATSFGTARTFSGCEITLQAPPSTGANGFSICMINHGENTLAGSQLNTYLIRPQRVLDGDPYFVEVE